MSMEPTYPAVDTPPEWSTAVGGAGGAVTEAWRPLAALPVGSASTMMTAQRPNAFRSDGLVEPTYGNAESSGMRRVTRYASQDPG